MHRPTPLFVHITGFYAFLYKICKNHKSVVAQGVWQFSKNVGLVKINNYTNFKIANFLPLFRQKMIFKFAKIIKNYCQI